MHALFLSKRVDSEELADVCATITEWEHKSIVILKNCDQIKSKDDISIVLQHLHGDYKTYLEIYGDSGFSEKKMASILSKKTSASALMSDHSQNPYTWKKISGTDIEHVSIDPVAYNENNTIIITN